MLHRYDRLVAKCDLQIARATHNFAVHGPVGDKQICPWYIVCSLTKYYECTGAVARTKHVTSRLQYCFNGFWMSRHVSTILTKFFNRHLAGPWSVSRSQRCVVSEFLYVVPWSFKCCYSKVWNKLRMISSLTFMPNVGVPFFMHFFPDRKWWPRNRKWRPFGVDWVPLVIKSLHRKNGEFKCFSCSRWHIRVFITFMSCFRLCIFHISLLWSS